MELNRTLLAGDAKLDEIALSLDAASGAERLAAIRALSPRAQAQLFEAAQGFRVLTLEDLVPASVAPRSEVVHHGRNSLPMFRFFAKVFCRPVAGASELWGYNASGFVVGTFVGPGYYLAHAAGGEVLIDYARIPEGKLDAWPPLKVNEAGLSRFVFAGMKDALRGVSRHVSIGRAIRGGQAVDNWFVLCREERLQLA